MPLVALLRRDWPQPYMPRSLEDYSVWSSPAVELVSTDSNGGSSCLASGSADVILGRQVIARLVVMFSIGHAPVY